DALQQEHGRVHRGKVDDPPRHGQRNEGLPCSPLGRRYGGELVGWIVGSLDVGATGLRSEAPAPPPLHSLCACHSAAPCSITPSATVASAPSSRWAAAAPTVGAPTAHTRLSSSLVSD